MVLRADGESMLGSGKMVEPAHNTNEITGPEGRPHTR